MISKENSWYIVTAKFDRRIKTELCYSQSEAVWSCGFSWKLSEKRLYDKTGMYSCDVKTKRKLMQWVWTSLSQPKKVY